MKFKLRDKVVLRKWTKERKPGLDCCFVIYALNKIPDFLKLEKMLEAKAMAFFLQTSKSYIWNFVLKLGWEKIKQQNNKQ